MADAPLILVTRPEPDATRTAAALADRGFTALAAPLTRIVHRCSVPVPSPEAEALVFTSAFAVAAAASQDWALAPLPVYAVGAHTAAAARAAGHDTVIDGGGEAASLLDVLGAAPERTFCHLRGHHVARDLTAPLAAAGKRLMALTVYDAVAVPLDPRPAGALAAGRAQTIGLWSPRAAALFAEILADHPDWPRHPLTAVAISARAAAALTGLGLRSVTVAAAPSGEGMMAAIEMVARG